MSFATIEQQLKKQKKNIIKYIKYHMKSMILEVEVLHSILKVNVKLGNPQRFDNLEMRLKYVSSVDEISDNSNLAQEKTL